MTIHPPDAAVAARSFPRRWRALFAIAAGDDDAPDVLQRSGAPALAAQAAAALGATADRLAGGRSATYGDGDPLDVLEHHAGRLADAIERVQPDDWAGERIDALTGGIEESAALLRQAEAAIEAARADRGG